MRCLVIQTAFLGDAILTVPLLGLLRRDERVSDVTVVAAPPGAGFLAGQRVADRVVSYDKRGTDAGTRGLTRIGRTLAELGPDVAIVPHRSFRSALLALLSRAPVRAGFDVSGGSWLLTRRLPYRAEQHEIDRIASLASAVGVAVPGGRVPFELTVPDGAGPKLDAALAGGPAATPPRIVVAPGSRWATKRWSPSGFAAAATTLSEELGAAVAVVGAAEDADVGAAVASGVETDVVDLTGALPLPQLVALVAGARLVLSNDSAVAHIAAGLGVPVVAVFGPTVPAQGFAPYTDASRIVEAPLPCRPCGRHGSERCRTGTHDCMELVAPGDVVGAALELTSEEDARA
jgi:heptosyltransferase-2